MIERFQFPNTSQSYVVESLRESGLAVVELKRAELRLEFGRPVEGLVVIAELAHQLQTTNRAPHSVRKFDYSQTG